MIFILVLELDLFMGVRRPAHVNDLRVLVNRPWYRLSQIFLREVHGVSGVPF